MECGGAPGSAEVGRSSKLARWTIAPDGKWVPIARTADEMRIPIAKTAEEQRVPIGRTALADARRVGFDVLRRAAMANMAVVEALRLQVLAGALMEFERAGLETRVESGESLVGAAAAAPTVEFECGTLVNGRGSPAFEEVKTGAEVQFYRLDAQDEAISLDEAEHDYFPAYEAAVRGEKDGGAGVESPLRGQRLPPYEAAARGGKGGGAGVLSPLRGQHRPASEAQVDAGGLSRRWALESLSHSPRGDLDVAFPEDENGGAGCAVLGQRRFEVNGDDGGDEGRTTTADWQSAPEVRLASAGA